MNKFRFVANEPLYEIKVVEDLSVIRNHQKLRQTQIAEEKIKLITDEDEVWRINSIQREFSESLKRINLATK